MLRDHVEIWRSYFVLAGTIGSYHLCSAERTVGDKVITLVRRARVVRQSTTAGILISG